mmetsp:Transcript_23690/g.52451  ORF Transcript_23690/g.52451 Transcript_23690/m.52451 type:complete len:130 (-) Transcript_23690:93-482(-)
MFAVKIGVAVAACRPAWLCCCCFLNQLLACRSRPWFRRGCTAAAAPTPSPAAPDAASITLAVVHGVVLSCCSSHYESTRSRLGVGVGAALLVSYMHSTRSPPPTSTASTDPTPPSEIDQRRLRGRHQRA